MRLLCCKWRSGTCSKAVIITIIIIIITFIQHKDIGFSEPYLNIKLWIHYLQNLTKLFYKIYEINVHEC